jgi:hypothetical protein
MIFMLPSSPQRMKNTVAFDVGETLCDLACHQPAGLLGKVALAFETQGERKSLEPFKRNEGFVIHRAAFMHADDVGVLKIGYQVHLALEAFEPLSLFRQRIGKYFQHHQAGKLQIERFHHARVAVIRKHAVDLEFAEQSFFCF